MNSSASQVAAQFLSVMPPALSQETLREYGLDLTRTQAQLLTKELLTLSFYWMACGLRLIVSKEEYQEILEQARQQILEAWETTLNLDGHSPNAFWDEMPTRFTAWEDIMQQGGDIVAVLGHAATTLATEADIDTADRQQILGILLDWTPIDEIGEIAEALENR